MSLPCDGCPKVEKSCLMHWLERGRDLVGISQLELTGVDKERWTVRTGGEEVAKNESDKSKRK